MRHKTILLMAAAAVGIAAWAMGQEANVGELVRELSGEKAAAQRTPEQLRAAYTRVLDAIMADMEGEDAGRRANAQRVIERLAFVASRPGAEAERAACSAAIADALARDVAVGASPWLIRQLERIGRAEAVPQLAKSLESQDEKIRDCARRALQKNSSPEAGEALRRALGAARTPEWRHAVVEAIAARCEPASAEVLLGVVTHQVAETRGVALYGDDTRIAAMRGLARIGDKSVIDAMAKKVAEGPTPEVLDCYLLLGDTLAGKGERREALKIYKSLAEAKGHVQCAAIIGLGRAGGADELPAILAAAGNADEKLRGAAVEALAMIKGEGITAATAGKFGSADVPTKVTILQGLTRRGDKSAAATFVTAADDADESVRIEAARGLGRLGNAVAVPVLLKLAAAGGNVQPVARWSLHELKAEAAALLKAIEAGNPKVRAEAIRALAMQHAQGTWKVMLKCAGESDAVVRLEAIRALGVVGPSEALAPLTAIVQKTEDGATRDEAARAIATIALRDAEPEKAVGPIIAAMQSSTGPAKLALIGVLGRIGGQRPLQAVRAALREDDAKVRDAAVRALADWPDVSAAEDLLAIAKSATEETPRVLALRGYIRVVRLENARPASQTAAMLAAALDAAKRPDEKKGVLGALAEVRDPAALAAVVPCLSDPALANEACNAAVRIGRDIVDRYPEPVKAAMRKVMETTKDQNTRKFAEETIGRADARLKKAGG